MMKMSSLFDDDDDDDSSPQSARRWSQEDGESGDSEADDATAFTVATVMEKRRSRNSRRDTITRIMPTISIHDKYAIPTTVDKKQSLGTEHQNKEERTHLRLTSSLMDNSSSDSEHDGDDIRRAQHFTGFPVVQKTSFNEDIFRTPSQCAVSSSKPTVLRRNGAANDDSGKSNLLDALEDNEDGVETSPNNTDVSNPVHRSDTFMSIYEDLATKTRTPSELHSTKENDDFPRRGVHVKTLVTKAFKNVAELAGHSSSNVACDATSWDVEKLSGKKRANDGNDYGQRNRRKSMNIRAELALVQDMLHEKTQECNELKRTLDESHSQIKALRTENAVVVQSKVIFESKLEVLEEACRAAETNASTSQAEAAVANARIGSLLCQIKESQSEINRMRHDLEAERKRNDKSACAAQKVESELERTKQEKEDVEKERDMLISRAELQDEVRKMRSALKEVRELESVRLNNTRRIEAELQGAHNALATANSTVETLREENSSLQSKLSHASGRTSRWKMEWKEGREGIEVAAIADRHSSAPTPKPAKLDSINALGAEDTSEPPSCASKMPLKPVLRGTPDSSSRQLSFASSTKSSTGKENNHTNEPCALCCRRPKGIMHYCSCGKDGCNKWAHAICLANRKSVSKSVSHPGTPAPPLPTILCNGLWNEI
ncbi:hypothetical protein ACHAWF_006853 [Thalassiosira exigua]